MMSCDYSTCKTSPKKGKIGFNFGLEVKAARYTRLSDVFYLPWQKKPATATELMSITVNYDKTELVKDDVLTANVRVTTIGRNERI